MSPSVSLEVGGRYVLFLGPRLSSAACQLTDLPMVFHAFPVQEDGNVQTPLDGSMSISRLSAALRATP